ncbi:thiamine pyrophosphate-binding protein [Couchioplanes azureus]|uniref:thiamine pyrophosphate-binding protein n=1 Tax=Couchioplanes caeruleus TaxID=56438 RepID=UPI00167087B1|nr:thiamine pyrophosphate-binding protein [Couchioplanes caeruleus]GGQ84157.1 acetolactate synthase [Couchioplanes caeruleus subsp. azureus]
MTERLRVVDYLVRELARAGVGHLFGVGGANIEDIYDAVHAGPTSLRGVVAKHEFSAATMADGSARTRGSLGVVAATSGGGAMNLVPGLAEAHASRVPILALVGQPPTASAGLGAFQDSSGLAGSFDAGQVFAPIARFCRRVTAPAEIVEVLPRAIAAALGDPRGPAVLLLPKDVQQAIIEVPSASPAPVAPRPPAGDPGVRRRAARALRGADRVLVVAGEGVAAADARTELAELVHRLGAWVAVTPDAKDVFDNRDPAFAGVAGVMGHPTVERCLRQADICLLVGTRLPMMARGGLDGALAATLVIAVGPEPPFVSGIALRGDVRGALRDLLDQLDPAPRPRPGHAGPVPLPDTAGTSLAAAMTAVGAALPADAHVFVDAGNTGAAAIHLLPAPRRGRFVVAVGMGGMGYTFGAGIGAGLATGRRTYVIAGDGAFFMHGMEVHTAVEYDAPVTFVVLNNNAHAMCVSRETLFYPGDYSYNLFHPADIGAGVAATFPRLDVTRADDAAALHRALLRTNAAPGPAFVALDLDPHEVPPFLPFLAAGQPSSPGGRSERGRVHVG